MPSMLSSWLSPDLVSKAVCHARMTGASISKLESTLARAVPITATTIYKASSWHCRWQDAT